jgi:quercetin dioxygenase-like cupin family protein
MAVEFVPLTDSFREWTRTREQIRQEGAVGSLCRGIEIETHGVRTRIIAWPGNGLQTQSLHVLTLSPGEESASYAFPSSEELMLCLKGAGEITMRGQRIEMMPGDLAYFPEGVPHQIWNRRGSGADLILVTQISQPPVHLYGPGGYYDVDRCRWNFDRIEADKRVARSVAIDPAFEMAPRDTYPKLRPQNLTTEEIRSGGALFSFFSGAPFTGLGDGQMRLALWPPYGARTANVHTACMPAGAASEIHTHPISDEALLAPNCGQLYYVSGQWVDCGQYDVGLAPCGVRHGIAIADRPGQPDSWPCGFASPPQVDLYMKTDYWTGEGYRRPAFVPYQA